MDLQEVKSNLNKDVLYNGVKYELVACILRKNEQGYFYQAEIKNKRANSVMICKLDDIKGVTE